MREGDTPEGASPKGLGWPLHREKKKNLNKMKWKPEIQAKLRKLDNIREYLWGLNSGLAPVDNWEKLSTTFNFY